MKDVREWFTLLNDLIFDGKLPMFNHLYIKSYRQYHALFQCWEEDGIRFNMLEVNKCFENKLFFVEVLAHEMVHLYQYIHDEPLDHGTTFLRWRFAFKQKGLELYKAA